MTKQLGPLLTVADLDALPDDSNRYELIEGEIFVSRAPSILHQSISRNLLADLTIYLRQNPIGKAWATAGVIFSDFNGIIPDIVFATNERLKQIMVGERLTGAPELMIEILSPGPENAKRDRVVKRQLYGKYGVQEYWIVDPENRTVEVYRLHEQLLDLAIILMEQDHLTSPLLPGFSCLMTSMFVV
jgi:Uma2 family endonuclease